MAIDVFIAYARADHELLSELGKHLSSLQRQGLINTWFDGDIVEGTEWRDQLLGHLRGAQVILLLISPDFIASRFCYDIEMKEALKRHDMQEARVIPVLLRPVDWSGLPFARIQAAPASAHPVTLWHDRDAAFLDVTKRIRKSIKELQLKPENREEKETFKNSDETQTDMPSEENPEPPEYKPSQNEHQGNVQKNSGNANSQQGNNNTMTVTHNSGITVNDILLVMKELESRKSKHS